MYRNKTDMLIFFIKILLIQSDDKHRNIYIIAKHYFLLSFIDICTDACPKNMKLRGKSPFFTYSISTKNVFLNFLLLRRGDIKNQKYP